MRIVVHDYVGHPFQVQLSRELARLGHDVLHLYCSSFVTPRGELTRRVDDPPNFNCRAIGLSETIPKTNFYRRLRLEAQYAPKLIAECEQFQPDVVISANTPSIPQVRLARWCAPPHAFRFVDSGRLRPGSISTAGTKGAGHRAHRW